MGTDTQGNDEFSRILYGARISLTVGVVAVFFGLIGGTTVGAIAGGAGGIVDGILMRVIDVLLAVPGILLAIGSWPGSATARSRSCWRWASPTRRCLPGC